MHNCNATRELFTDLLFDGVDFRSDEAITAELNQCPECRAEFQALSATLRMTSRTTDVAAPSEDYWTNYHSKLRQRLAHAQTETTASRAKAQRRKEELGPLFEPLRPGAGTSFFTRFLKTSVPVPLPLAMALVVAAALLVSFAIRAARKDAQPSTTTTYVRVPVEVPLVQERTVTQIVYRDRPRVVTTKRTTEVSRAESTFAKRTELVPASLTGFKPPDEIKLTVIKGGVPDER